MILSTRILTVSLVIVFSVPVTIAEEMERFYLVFRKCEMIGANMVAPSKELFRTDGETLRGSCAGRSERIVCSFQFSSESSPESAVYKVERRSSTVMSLYKGPLGGDWIEVNPTNSTAVMISRVLSPVVSGAKVCAGVYLTEDQLTAIEDR